MSALDPQVVDVLFITADKGGSAHYRAELPARRLADEGVSTYVGTIAGSAPNGLIYTLDGPPSDTVGPVFGRQVILQRHAAPMAVGHIRAARAAGQRIWMDADDLLPAAPADNIARTDPEGIAWWTAMLSAADGVVCSTETLSLGMARYNRRRIVLPNMFDGDEPGRWPSLPSPASTDGRRFVGWVGNTVTHRPNLRLLADWLPDLLERTDTGMVWGGMLPELAEDETIFSELTGVPLQRVYSRPAQPMHLYPTLFRGFDIGLVPLADSRFARAKTALKGLEYAAARIPFVWSDHPAYRDVFGTTGRCRHSGDFRRQVASLIADSDLRKEMADRQWLAMRRYSDRAGLKWARSVFCPTREKVEV